MKLKEQKLATSNLDYQNVERPEANDACLVFVDAWSTRAAQLAHTAINEKINTLSIESHPPHFCICQSLDTRAVRGMLALPENRSGILHVAQVLFQLFPAQHLG